MATSRKKSGARKKTATHVRDQSASDEANANILREMIFERDAQLGEDDSKLGKTA